MAKASPSSTTASSSSMKPALPLHLSSSSPNTTFSADLPPPTARAVIHFFQRFTVSDLPIHNYTSKDFFSDLVTGHLKANAVQRGRVTCSLFVKPPFLNYYEGLHGGAVAAVAERVAIASARTVVAEEKELFLGELGISYLSAAPANAELIVDGSVVRSGRNLTVVTIDFKMKETGKLAYAARATFYNSPVSKL